MVGNLSATSTQFRVVGKISSWWVYAIIIISSATEVNNMNALFEFKKVFQT